MKETYLVGRVDEASGMSAAIAAVYGGRLLK